MTRKLQKAFKKQKKSTKQEVPQLTGTLGIPLGGARIVEVPGRNSYVYVRLRNNQNEVIQAFNNQVAPSYNLPVIVERHGNRYSIIAVDTQRYENNQVSFSPYLPRHGNTHSFDLESGGGGDIVWVQSRQMMPILILPSGTSGAGNVVMAPYTLRKENGNWIYVGNTGTQNISSYRPSSPTGAIMGLVYLDATDGNPYFIINSGTVFSNVLTGTSQIAPYIPQVASPATQIPLAAIRLITGTNALSWDNIYDVRQWLHTVPTGTGGGGGVSTVITGTSVQDEGVPLGVVGTFNFVGNGVDVSVSGTVARVHISGSSGGGVSNLTGTFVGVPSRVLLTNSLGQMFTGDWFAWGTNGSQEFVEFGADVAGKETNAGRVGYELFSSGYMEAVGAGTSAPNRWWRFYDNVKINSHLQTDSHQILGLLSSWAYFNETGTAVGPINAPQQTIVTGSDYVLGINGSDNSSVKMLITDVAEAVFYSTPIGAFLGGVQVPAATTWYGAPWKATADVNQNSIPWMDSGVLNTMALRVSTTQPAAGTLVATLQVNGVDTALTVTVTNALGSPVTVTDSTHVVVISVGDTLRWKFVNNAPATASATLQAMTMKLNKNATA
jgi:hypothetical protein